MFSLAEVLEWKYGCVAGTRQVHAYINELNALVEQLSLADEEAKSDIADQISDLKAKLEAEGANPEMEISYWKHPSIPQPDKAQLALDMAEYVAYRESVEYKGKRKSEYPDIGEQLDALWKGLEASGLTPNINAGEGTPERMLADIKAVKSKHPKPA